MKKILFIMLVVGLLVSLTFVCVGAYQRFYMDKQIFGFAEPVVYMTVDQNTGVNYLVVKYCESLAVTPLYNADGTFYVTKRK